MNLLYLFALASAKIVRGDLITPIVRHWVINQQTVASPIILNPYFIF